MVTLDDRVHYLGPHGSPESYDKYKVLVAEWAAAKPQRQTAAREGGRRTQRPSNQRAAVVLT